MTNPANFDKTASEMGLSCSLTLILCQYLDFYGKTTISDEYNYSGSNQTSRCLCRNALCLMIITSLDRRLFFKWLLASFGRSLIYGDT